VTVVEVVQRRREPLNESQKLAVQTLKRRQEERGTGGAGDMDAVGDE
jgi:hypothetical protein